MSRFTDFMSIESTPRDGTTSRGNAGFVAPGQTAIKFNLDQVDMTSSRTVPLYKVPANKMLAITDLTLSHDGNTAVRVALSIGGDGATNLVTIFSQPVKGDTAPLTAPGIETQLDVPQGLTLYVTWAANNGVNLYMNLCAVEQTIGAS